jgi:predicted transcriptional regulator
MFEVLTYCRLDWEFMDIALERLSMRELKVLFKLGSKIRNSGKTSDTVHEMASYMGMSESSIRKGLTELKKCNIIQKNGNRMYINPTIFYSGSEKKQTGAKAIYTELFNTCDVVFQKGVKNGI